jgi:N-methylhydantoinase B
VPDQWYGDYLAMLGAARIGEARLKELCARYGRETLERFVEEWFDYSERRVAHVISQMPRGTIVGHGRHDPFGPAPDGIPIDVKVTVDPDAAVIEVDLTDNVDCLPAGVNESRTCAMNNCMTGVFNSIDPDIPHNAGTFRRVKVKLRENCVVGIPRFPHSCSVATTNVGERLVVTTQKAFADAWDGYGLAEGACGIGPGFAVVSGSDWRRGGDPYVNQKFLGSQGGPGGPEHDGWLTYGNAVTNGLMFRDSVEIDEQKYPIRVREIRVRPDSEGAGRRRGAPGTRVAYGPKRDPMTAAYVTDCHYHPPRGARGGGDAAASIAFRVRVDGSEEPLRPISQEELAPGELLGQLLSGGGGYGDPLEREPERVREDVLARFVTLERAREVYGVVFANDLLTDALKLDAAATERRRAELREARA